MPDQDAAGVNAANGFGWFARSPHTRQNTPPAADRRELEAD